MRKELGHAIAELRQARGLTQATLGDAIGVDRGNISRYESGRQAPDFDRLVKLAEVLGTNLSSLLTLAETGRLEGAMDIKGTVPLISEVQAGHWREVIDNLQPGEGERIKTTAPVRRYTYALRVSGDSMEPKFPEGCVVIVEPEESADPGRFIVVRQNGHATLKQLVQDGNRLYLKPLNPRYPIMEMAHDAELCGVVKKIQMDV